MAFLPLFENWFRNFVTISLLFWEFFWEFIRNSLRIFFVGFRATFKDFFQKFLWEYCANLFRSSIRKTFGNFFINIFFWLLSAIYQLPPLVIHLEISSAFSLRINEVISYFNIFVMSFGIFFGIFSTMPKDEIDDFFSINSFEIPLRNNKVILWKFLRQLLWKYLR